MCMYENETDFFSAVKIENFDIFNIYDQNIDRGHMLELTSTHNLCFGAKILRKICIPLHTPCFPDKFPQSTVLWASSFPLVGAALSVNKQLFER